MTTAQSNFQILDVEYNQRGKLHSLSGASVPVVFEIHPAPYFCFNNATFLLPSPISTGRA